MRFSGLIRLFIVDEVKNNIKKHDYKMLLLFNYGVEWIKELFI